MDCVGLHARLSPERRAVLDLEAGKEWSYAGLDHAICQMVRVLQARSVSHGDRVAVLSKNRAEFVILHFACARMGAILVPLNWRLSAKELANLIADAEPRLVLGDDLLDTLNVTGLKFERLLLEPSEQAQTSARPTDRAAPSLILYTSGTTGQPKGVLINEENVEETAINLGILVDVDRSSCFLCDAPMFHIIGLIACVRAPLFQGGCVIISNGFVPSVTLERLTDPDLAVTHYFSVPQMTEMLRCEPGFDAQRIRHLKTIITGGAPHAPTSILKWLNDDVMLTNGFGMSETGTVFNMPLDLSISKQKAGSVGVPSHRTEARIVDANGDPLPANTPGELQIRGPNVTSGYWRRDDATREAFAPGQWFRTGDVASYDEDGFFWIIDRIKDMYISGGENVYPAEVEALVNELPNVKECAVVRVDDDFWGEVGHLYWVSDTLLDERVIVDHLAERLASYKLPKRFSKIDALPRNGAGKILKKSLMKQIGA